MANAMKDAPPFAVEPDNPAVRARFVARCGHRHGLTPTQATILYIMLRGVTRAADIAEELCRSEDTINCHLAAIYETLGVHCAIGAVRRTWPRYVRAGEDVHILRLGEMLEELERRACETAFG